MSENELREALLQSEAARERLMGALRELYDAAPEIHPDPRARWGSTCEKARAALSASPSAVLAEREAMIRREMREWFVTNVLDGALIAGATADATTVRSALAEHDAKVRAAALDEAADHAEDWTCPQCDQDTARDLASEIRALASTPSETKEPK